MIELPFALETQAQTLVLGWKRHFATQDAQLAYTHAERAHFLELRRDVVLVGIIDAEGDDFFAEYKTANPRGKKTWKREWLLSPQALTYGLFTGGQKRYLVRKAFKQGIPEYDHEWFEFSPRDLDIWRFELLRIADEIQSYYQSIPAFGGDFFHWPLNIAHGCFAYGPTYACPFWADGCSVGKFDHRLNNDGDWFFPEFQNENRAALLGFMEGRPHDTIILSQSRVETWMRCRELFRKKYVEGNAETASEAMLLGSRFHQLIAEHVTALIAQRSKPNGTTSR